MLLKINRVKGLGVFSEYAWSVGLPAFERFNVIYGDNGTGKTTLSRFLACLPEGHHIGYPDLEYGVETQSGLFGNSKPTKRKVRVFNADFVFQNIGQLEGNLKPILVIGEENRAAAAELEKAELELTGRDIEIAAAQVTIERCEKDRGKEFTAIAKIISEATSGSTLRNYRKNNAEAAFEKLKEGAKLTSAELTGRQSTLRQEQMDKLSVPSFWKVRTSENEKMLSEFLSDLASNANSLCRKTAAAAAIERLKRNASVALWVEQGLAIHKELKATECEFCRQVVPDGRWGELEAHFNEADAALKLDIEKCLASVELARVTISSANLPQALACYSELRRGFGEAKVTYDNEVGKLLGSLDELAQQLKTKQTKRTEAIDAEFHLDLAGAESALLAVAAIILLHNDKTDKFEEAKSRARDDIESHYLRTIQQHVSSLDSKIKGANEELRLATEGDSQRPSITKLRQVIAEKRAKISDAHRAGDELTKLLHTFLGRNELVFVSGDEGYRVYRNGEPATRVSDGERNAIAFIYFIVQLADRDFTLSDGIVVIDDPVSSLDANSVYQAFSFLKNGVKNAKQVFLLTHNFGFLRLILNWLNHMPKSEGKKQFYMVVCGGAGSDRRASLRELDSALRDHPTEYHFLFKVLANFKSDGTIASSYHIPNVVRKVLETFLDFYDPSTRSVYAKLMDAPFDENKRSAIYKFANDLSHFTGQGFEPGFVEESQKNTIYLLEMIKELAPKHYDGLSS